ncbi:MAG: hypothetical protein JW864_12635 [Spirochaetes bacterium]|nr:hypothetical protein [Spirochaetota bacterium]
MEIQINDYPVDFELTEEQTISDVINSISEWTQERDLIFTEAGINDHNYTIDNLPNIALDEIKTLNCHVQSKSNLIISSINAGIEYCNKVQEFLEKSLISEASVLPEVDNIKSGIDWLMEVLGKVQQLLGIDFNEILFTDNSVQYYIDRITTFGNGLNLLNGKNSLNEFFEKEKSIFADLAGIFKMLLMSEDIKLLVIQSIDSPDVLVRSLYEIKSEIPSQVKNLENISISYQTGKDDIAAEKLNDFIDFVFQFSRTSYQIVPVFGIDPDEIKIDDLSFNEKNNELQDLLKEIIEVMENDDIISLSDILEYEMKPSFEKLDEYIDSVIKFLEKRK